MFSVPLYFQVVQEASNTAAGARLIPAFVGNTVGALTAGIYISKTGRYKNLTLAAQLTAVVGYLVMIFRWGGKIYNWEAFEILPGGFATGLTSASIFIALTSNMGHENIAVATSGLYLCSSLGSVLGISISSSIQRGVLKLLLERRISDQAKTEVRILDQLSRLRLNLVDYWKRSDRCQILENTDRNSERNCHWKLC